MASIEDTGIASKALIEGKPIIANDVLSDEWSKTYHQHWPDTRGLGLSISIAIIQQLGGSLKLVNNSKPTEFHLILPKIFKDAPNDSFR